jgi:hypothetical protein
LHEDELTETIRAHYPTESVNKMMHLWTDLVHNGMAAEANFEKEYPNFDRDVEKWANE